MVRARILQHAPFEGPGSIETWLSSHAAEFAVTHLYAGDPLPDLTTLDLLIAMGGPMSVNDEATYPWLAEEKRYLRMAIDQGKAVLGICLGAQLIAAALGAPVTRNSVEEIGWFPVYALPIVGRQPVFQLPPELQVFHWHGETFGLPAGAIHLAHSAACTQQAFQFGERVIGLQFHLEMTEQTLAEMLAQDDSELVPAPWVQSPAEIMAAPPQRYERNQQVMDSILDYLVRT